jgi:hypothetical protein
LVAAVAVVVCPNARLVVCSLVCPPSDPIATFGASELPLGPPPPPLRCVHVAIAIAIPVVPTGVMAAAVVDPV